MAAVVVPGAIWRPDPISTTPIGDLRWIICHTVVGTIAGSIGGRHYHIYVEADGTYIQIQDLRLRSAASVDANPYSIAIVAEDKGPAFPTWSGNDVPAYTDAQVESITFCVEWIMTRFGLPPEALHTSRPDEPDGCGWHRLGIPGNFPPTWPLWGRQPGGQTWSTTTGKACPGDRRIRQLVDVIIPAIQLPEEPDVKPDPSARYLPFEFSKLSTPTGSSPSVDVVTNQTRQSETQVTTTTVAKAVGGTGTPTLQTASLVAEASGGVIGAVPWKPGGGHYGSAWDKWPTGGWPAAGFDEYAVGAVFAPDGNGYWLVSQRGGVLTFGSAKPPTWATPIWDRDVVGAKRNTGGKLVVVFADGTEQTSTT